MDFDNALLNVHNSILHAPILATNFHNDKEILYIMCQEVVIGLKKKKPKVLKEFDIRIILLQRKKTRPEIKCLCL